MNIKINMRNIGFSIFFTVLLFIVCLEDLSNIYLFKFILKHVDEMLVLLLLFYDLIHYSLLIKRKGRLIFLWLLFLLVGITSSAIYQYQSMMVSLIDMVLIISRFIIAYLATYVFLLKSKRTISNSMFGIAKIVTLSLLIIAVHDFFLPPLFPKGDYRHFAYSLKLMFPHPTYLSSCGVTLFIYFGYKEGYNKKLYMLSAAFIVFSTLRAKALGFLALYTVFIIMLKGRYGKKHPIQMSIFGLGAAILVGWEQIKEYFFTSGYSPRLLLLKDSIKIAIEHFPFGGGFASFGSPLAAEYYSPLYVQLGYNNNWGMSSNYSAFLNDAFWPTIIGELGVIGLIIFTIICLLLIKYALKTYKDNKIAGFSMLAVLGYMLVTSLAETSFLNPTSMLLFMMFAVFEVEVRSK